jgi:hypothetical protein
MCALDRFRQAQGERAKLGSIHDNIAAQSTATPLVAAAKTVLRLT